jgi:circadian clock protein KaiB
MKPPVDSLKEFENASKSPPSYFLRLYVAGATRQSSLAIRTIRALCEERLRGEYELEVVDVYQNPALAREDQVVALPTLVKKRPPPARKLIGDLSDTERVLLGLDLQTRAKSHENEARDGKPQASR